MPTAGTERAVRQEAPSSAPVTHRRQPGLCDFSPELKFMQRLFFPTKGTVQGTEVLKELEPHIRLRWQ